MKNVHITLRKDTAIGTISPLLYGHFAEQIGGVINGGIWVGKGSSIPNIHGFRLELLKKLKKIAPPVIRWPGGCFAETYDWRDGVGEDRPVRPGWWTREDGLYEHNGFGTHEFMEFCRLVGAEPYIAVNTTSLSPLEARHWVDYCNSPPGTTTLAALREKNGSAEPFDVKFIGVGNENWGGGGTMCAQQYAWEYRKYATVLRNVAPKARLVAGGANFHSIQWAKTFLESIREGYGTPVQLDAISLHYYYTDDRDVGFSREGWDRLIRKAQKTEALLQELIGLLKEHGRTDTVKLYLDEWGSMYTGGVGAREKNQLFRQQVTQRDAVAAALTFHILHRHCGNVEMANIAQMANCLSALFLTEGEACITTPVYHVFDMFRPHQGAMVLATACDDPEVSVSASQKDGTLLLTLANLSYDREKRITLELTGIPAGVGRLTLLAPEDPGAYNDFDAPERVCPTEAEWNPSQQMILPGGGVMALRIPCTG